jgi:LacI family transcriptional regulator
VSVTIADVAARAGVSKTTVSRVLNGKGDLHESTAARIREAMVELGYVPSSRGVSLGRDRNSVVAMLVPSLSWPWVGEIVQGAVDVIEAEGYGLMLLTCNRTDQSMKRFASHVSASAFDGLLVVQEEGTRDYISGLHTRSRPVVVIDDRQSSANYPGVSTTNRWGAQLAAQHLADLGRRRPAVITGPLGFRCTRERTEGFVETFAAAGLPVDPSRVVPGLFTYESGVLAVERLFRERVQFDSLFAHNDLSAAGAMARVQAAGLRVPEDVAVIGFDDAPMAAQASPPLTTVRQPCRDMGEAAARLLMAQLDGTTDHDIQTVIPATLVVRESTQPCVELPTTVAAGHRAV